MSENNHYAVNDNSLVVLGDQIIGLLREHGPLTSRTICERLGCTRQKFGDAVRNRSHLIQLPGRGRGRTYSLKEAT